MKKVLMAVCLFLFTQLQSQDFLGLQSSNYAGVIGAYSNPANIVDNRFVFDMALIGFNASVENNYIGIKRKALKYTGSFTNPGSVKFPDSWSNNNPNSPDYFKNNLNVVNNGKDKAMYFNSRVVLPSFLISINGKNAVAFTASFRNFLNMRGVGQDFASLAYSEFTTSSLLNTYLLNKNFSFMQASWMEYGLTYARVIKSDNEHFFKAGITPKLLQGLEAFSLNVSKLEYIISTKDTFSFFNTQASVAYSSNLDAFNIKNNTSVKYQPVYGFGMDIGAVYEWRPDYDTYKYNMDGETNLWRKDKNKYKLKASFALLDIGQIKFKRGEYSTDFNININRFNVDKFAKVSDLKQFHDTAVALGFISSNKSGDLKLLMPTAINAQLDYHIWKPFYVNLLANITNLQSRRSIRVNDYSNISLAPRFDHKWFGFTLPVTYNVFSGQRQEPMLMGAMLRLGPLVVGSNDLLNYFTGDLYGANLYFLLRVPIPYGHKKDKDKDGISNRKDKCKEVPGVWEFKGCPDKDGDHVQDSEDRCPEVAGLKELQGCPDKDSDGITDLDDMCPDSAGTAEFKGCPDRDGDKIIDRLDACPDESGIAEFNGCPDKDGDGTQDKEDRCPDIFGPKEFKGCPDKDGDGLPDVEDACPEVFGTKEHKGCPDKDGDTVLDKEDGCPEVAGPVENKGCPWPDTDKDGIADREDSCITVPGEARFKGCPPPIKAAERKIIEKAFASLEFATGKDVIKPKSLPSLNELAKLLIKHKEDWTLKLSGHTDNEGTPEANLQLSEKRAKAVKNYLVKKGALDAQIVAEWFGQTMPIADNATPQGRQKNRRVEMKILFKE